jgi:hypothetical protein
MEVPIWNYIIAMVVLIILIAFAIYGYYWDGVNNSHTGTIGPTGQTGFTGCTGTGYTGTIIINSISQSIMEDFEPEYQHQRFNNRRRHLYDDKIP